jgi:hypothetical protein
MDTTAVLLCRWCARLEGELSVRPQKRQLATSALLARNAGAGAGAEQTSPTRPSPRAVSPRTQAHDALPRASAITLDRGTQRRTLPPPPPHHHQTRPPPGVCVCSFKTARRDAPLKTHARAPETGSAPSPCTPSHPSTRLYEPGPAEQGSTERALRRGPPFSGSRLTRSLCPRARSRPPVGYHLALHPFPR